MLTIATSKPVAGRKMPCDPCSSVVRLLAKNPERSKSGPLRVSIAGNPWSDTMIVYGILYCKACPFSMIPDSGGACGSKAPVSETSCTGEGVPNTMSAVERAWADVAAYRAAARTRTREFMAHLLGGRDLANHVPEAGL